MTNPHTLLLSIAATACGFILTLVGVAGPGPIASGPAVDEATAPGLISAVAHKASHFDPVPFAVALDPVVRGPAVSLDAADPVGGPDPSLHGRAGWPQRRDPR